MTDPTPLEFRADITKRDDERQVAYGWASVYRIHDRPVIDRQGDRMSEAEVVNMAQRFISEMRVAKTMHNDQPPIGEVVESLVLTAAIQKTLGIDLGREGWFVGVKINDPDVWARVKAGELAAFSIGGAGRRAPVEEAHAST